MNTPVQTETLVLLDRNVVSVIKDANAGKEQKGPKQQRILERLREIDKPQYAVSPILSLIEGERGREDSADEKATGLAKETRALADFFDFASTDSRVLADTAAAFVSVFTGMRETKTDQRAQLLARGGPLVAQKIAAAKRRDVEEMLRDIAVDLQLDHGDAMLMLLVACLYGNEHARNVIKPTAPGKAYNVLSDIHLIPRLELVKIQARKLPIPLDVQFWTLDEGLDHVLSSVVVASSRIARDGELQMELRYLPRLFPDLAEDEAIDLLQRLARPGTMGAG
jgi:hypothetical protein